MVPDVLSMRSWSGRCSRLSIDCGSAETDVPDLLEFQHEYLVVGVVIRRLSGLLALVGVLAACGSSGREPSVLVASSVPVERAAPRFRVEPDGELCHRVIERASGKVVAEHCLRGEPGIRPINTREQLEVSGVRLRVIVLRDDISLVEVRPLAAAWSMVGQWLLVETPVEQMEVTVLRISEGALLGDCPMNEFDKCYRVDE